MTTTIIIMPVLLVLFTAFMVFLRILSYIAFSPMRKIAGDVTKLPGNEQYMAVRPQMLELIGNLEKLDFEGITIESHDGLKLFGRYYERQKPNVIEIDFHGYRGHAQRDYCGGSTISIENGISSILVDQRSHTESEGNVITFGIKERYDVICWVNYVINRFGSDVKIILAGVSMGAATVLMASELDLPKNVVGIIADCPYSSPEDIIRKVTRDKGLSDTFLYPFTELSAKIFAHFNLREASPVEAVKHTNIPILILHGEDDRFVPHHMGKAVFDACASENKTFVSFPNAGHALSYFADTQKYKKAITEFVNSLI